MKMGHLISPCRNGISSRSIVSLFAIAIAIANTLRAEEPATAKNLAIQPALHPGTEAAHESFNAISKAGEAPLVFLGDSITAGWNGRGKAVWDEFWVALHAVNFGIGGDRTEHILWRLQHGNYDGLHPKLTVLMIGTNNTGHEGRAMAEHGGAIYASSAEQTSAMNSDSGQKDSSDPVERASSRPDFQGLIYPGKSDTFTVEKNMPPVFIACGYGDRPDIAEGMAALYLKYKAADVKAELHIYSNAGHGFGYRPDGTGAAAGWVDRFTEWLADSGFLP